MKKRKRKDSVQVDEVTPSVKCVDLFCGAGGLTYGLTKEGIQVVAGYDIDKNCEHAYSANNPDSEFVNCDIAELEAEQLKARFCEADVRILAGCAPCQPFSSYSHRYSTVGTPRWGLLYHFANLARKVQPDIIAMENVPNLVKHKVFIDFLETLEDLKYEVFADQINCAHYGLPQRRNRTVLLASRFGPIELVPTRSGPARTVREAIGNLRRLSAGEVDPTDPLHVAASLSELNMERMLASKPGGTWRDWPPYLVAECHAKASGKTYPGVYGRMEWDRPAPAMTTQFFGFGNGRFGHPEQNRAITLREGAILQGFPKTYSFVKNGDPIHFKVLGRLIGNAVPVTLGRVIGKSINTHLEIVLKSKVAVADAEAPKVEKDTALLA